jgi:uncharacterized protein (TIGR02452 family)
MSLAHNRGRDRDALREIARSTVKAINYNQFRIGNSVYELNTLAAVEGTRYFEPNSLSDWRFPSTAQSSGRDSTQTCISILQITTLHCSRILANSLWNSSSTKIGILNFASATKPGGGFINGAQAQEESIARSSTLYSTLMSDNAQEFYRLHNQDYINPFYTDAIIYSPGVEVFRDDNGAWITPIVVDVLTCAAVNARELRDLKLLDRRAMEDRINLVMKERMARILYLFEKNGIRNIVLGSFGTGVFGNSVSVVAQIWADLLSVPSARFRGSFDRVMFAIIDKKTFDEFHFNFDGRSGH